MRMTLVNACLTTQCVQTSFNNDATAERISLTLAHPTLQRWSEGVKAGANHVLPQTARIVILGQDRRRGTTYALSAELIAKLHLMV